VEDTNIIVVTGNLTRDPELSAAPSGTSIGKLRIGVNGRRKNGTTGVWVDKPNFFDVTVFGKSAENAAKYLAKGRRVLIEGRLDWSEWETKEGGKRQSVQIIGGKVTYLPSGKPAEEGEAESSEVPAESETADLAAVGAGADGDEDIPF
jgi:single-strand DNA-binding protein